nr:immunoglobulin heavy chain junction region [Macaca mulatta]MOX60324.1 immunoglobulin heavy chain junction region [Macaca mulatta]MOX63174.1 immunoglobulin heavy chain junction region [Macaca mulatta]MOX63523.1 immunoglobulin heavy chain junction region [Macaca mulatta]MOX63859.1 immunoglobulin heavy chain junction region [Macaca mulatta]
CVRDIPYYNFWSGYDSGLDAW